MVCGRSNQIWPLPSHELETETKSSEDDDDDDEGDYFGDDEQFPPKNSRDYAKMLSDQCKATSTALA